MELKYMASARERIEAELGNILIAVNDIVSARSESNLSRRELAGVAAFVHSFYNGVENILKQALIAHQVKLAHGDQWHKMLLSESVRLGLISAELRQELLRYLAFRHFFVHGYAFRLEESEMRHLVEKVDVVFAQLQRAITTWTL
jgi:uncharacterized protein YutE (UPF0331/DUF86 family)